MLMRQCGWCLLLGKERVFDIRQLREHFDTDIVAGYLYGGVLESWLSEAGEHDILARVKKIDMSGDVGGQLEFIFGVRPEKKPEEITPSSEKVKKALEARSSAISAGSSFTAGSMKSSFHAGSFRSGSFRNGSFRNGSFRNGSFRNGSFRAGSLLSGSFNTSSFYVGSFRAGHLLSGSFRGYLGMGSFRIGSFRLIGFGKTGSFRPGSGFRFGRRFTFGSGGGYGGSFSRKLKSSFTGGYGSGGSFRYYAGDVEITGEEYHRTLINLSSCPLNEYGYGIHLI